MGNIKIPSVCIPIEIIGSFEQVNEICIKQDLTLTNEQYKVIHSLAINLKLGQKAEGNTGNFYPIVEKFKTVDGKEEFRVSSFIGD